MSESSQKLADLRIYKMNIIKLHYNRLTHPNAVVFINTDKILRFETYNNGTIIYFSFSWRNDCWQEDYLVVSETPEELLKML